jgi:hypothetical protein
LTANLTATAQLSSTPDDPRGENTVALFSTIYLGGIPATITNDSAFLSFVNVLSAVDGQAQTCREKLSLVLKVELNRPVPARGSLDTTAPIEARFAY